ncbi:HAUS augmin-like complex subunit 7 [Ophiophagus hannah]|uniref:HAUS augmin-like complex subunit 7 n=1 Tax=Ophiophagus hannah TaxID=8665 RepID=V8P9I8_OPHHA|nr:HAUS augmin-like complex subunit 7 [Ophiophagus hannah]
MAVSGVVAIYGRLKELGCPALEGVYLSDAEDIQKLLFSPSSHRLDILEWICVSTEESFQEIARKNEEFIKQVFYSPDLQAVLNPEGHPWNSDIKPLLLGEERQQKRALRSMTSHEQTLLETSEELEKTAAALENLRAQGNPAGADPSNNTAMALQSLKLIVSDYSQLLTAFEQVYENELQKHCERPAPKLSPCDPLFQAELQGLAKITETSECIMAMVQRWHEQKVFWNGSTIATLRRLIFVLL